MWQNVMYNYNMEIKAIIVIFNRSTILVLYLKAKSPTHRQLHLVQMNEMDASHLLMVK
jgi:hypothetical protein